MKRFAILALAAALVLSVTACSPRDGDGSSSSSLPLSSSVPEPSSSLEEESSSSSLPAKPEDSSQAESAMSTDLKQIGTLDGTKLGWGPGTNKDEQGRPYGATQYQEKYGKYNAHYIAPDSKNIYLTFDEGYENGYTEKILDALKEKDAHAVFFVTLPYVKQNTALVQRMIDEGHIVGNHSDKHLSYPDLSLEDARADVLRLHDYMKENFDYEMTLFRFPMGEFCEKDLALLQSMGYKTVFWSFAYRDWEVDKQMGTQTAFQKVTESLHPGEIMLLHAVSKDNAEILPQLIDHIRAQGYTVADYDVDYTLQDVPAKDSGSK